MSSLGDYPGSSERLLCFILAAEDLAKEQALAKIGLALTDSKLLTLSEQMQELDEKLKNAYIEDAKLKVNYKEDAECMTVLKLKSASICDELAKTMKTAASQVKNAETEKVYYTNKLYQISVDRENLHGLVKSMSLRAESSEESITPCETKMQDFQLKHSKSETLTAQSIRNLQSEIHGKEEEIDTLRKQIVKLEDHIDSLEKQLSQLLDKSKAQKLLAERGSDVMEVKKQFYQMLESKQSEFLRELQRISKRNELVINSIRRRYEVNKKGCIKLEKEKAVNAAVDMEKKWDKDFSECKEKSKQHLIKLLEEHTGLVNRICEEIDKKEADLNSIHCEDLKKLFYLAENELRARTKLLQKNCEAELKQLRSQHEEERMHLGEELNLQKEKEEKQKALLQPPFEDKEVTSRKICLIQEEIRGTKTGAEKIDLQKMISAATSAKASKDLKSKRDKERIKMAELKRTAIIGNSPVSIDEFCSGDIINLESLGLKLTEEHDQIYEEPEDGEIV